MKKKGISLIVLIITIVVIIILAASIILNMSKINIINNANEAVLRQDIATLQSELDLYVADRYVDEKGKYNRVNLNADKTKATYGTESIEDKNGDGNSNIYDILTVLNDSRYKDSVYIEEGKLVFKKSKLTDKEIEMILEMGLRVDGMPKVESVVTENTYTSIQVSLEVAQPEELEKVIYILNDGEREESTELTRTFSGLTPGVNYTLEVILVLKDGTEISRKEIISTKNIDGELTYTLSETEWTNKDVTVAIDYSEESIPENYMIQYRIKDVDGNIVQDWTEYTEPVVLTSNNTSVIGRLYNVELQDEKIASNTTVTKIDKDVPTIPTVLTLRAEETAITALADGSEDIGSGLDKYMYSIDNTTWNEDNEFTDLNSGTAYTIYARAIDNAGNESEIKSETISTKTPPISPEVIKTQASKYYGKKVNYTAPNGFNNWQLFHSDGENIYLIAGDYVPNTLVARQANVGKVGSYKVYLSKVLSKYTGTSDVTDERIKALNNDYYNVKGYSDDKHGAKGMAYLLDITEWNKGFKADNAQYAIGGPTIELLRDSYNAKYGTSYTVTATASGYTTNFGNMWNNVTDSQYVITNITNAKAVWIASLAGGNDDGLYRRCLFALGSRYDSGNYNPPILNSQAYAGNTNDNASHCYGIRPIVCLNTNVELELVGDTFNIVEIEE